ncbi:hypothetical protein ASD11_07835 [Aeromicrobium sp. Root495]|uniref:CAP domain-containing protein n=1 Tax=Aeromicrobium sp. Root495 TaxID=1736550 RepID=UPI0006FA27C0|nr:CAP domain-containing protein [Aeromicrobium sp. Root495]KQY59463.1 hypothetical protein ASD11_07835 [Aeromicrobium sp. Root495]
MRNLRIITCAVALVVGLGISPAQAISTDNWEKQVFSQSNKERKERGIKVTARSACLDKYTKSWISNVYADGKLTGSDHRGVASLIKVMTKCGYTTIGENLAMGQTSGYETVTDWMNSPGHRANLLNKKYSVMGVAAVKHGGRWWTVQLLAGK